MYSSVVAQPSAPNPEVMPTARQGITRESSAWFRPYHIRFVYIFFLAVFLASSRLLLSFFSWGHPSPSSSFSSFYYSFFFLPPSLISLPYFTSFSSFSCKCSLSLTTLNQFPFSFRFLIFVCTYVRLHGDPDILNPF